MTDKPLYKYVDGEPMVSSYGFALLMGIPYERLRAELDRQHAENPSSNNFRMPRAWSRQGNRIRKETQAALGYEAGMKECLDYLAADQSTAPRSETPMPETAAPTKREFVLRVTQDWEYEVTAESPDDAEKIFNELGSRTGKSECTGYNIESIVSADKKDDYDAEDERAKCVCGHLLDSDHTSTGCHQYRCDCTGATPLPFGEES